MERFFACVACAQNRVRPDPGLARLNDDIVARRRSRVVVVTGRRLDGELAGFLHRWRDTVAH